MNVGDFTGQRALILHRDDHHREALTAQLHRIGLTAHCVSPDSRLADVHADVIFFDADLGHENLFPWGRAAPPVPLIALLGSEAPGRLEWALAQAASAFMVKPITSSGAFQALVVAHYLHGEIVRLQRSVAELSDRVRARPLVVRAVCEVMRQQRLDEQAAMSRLRHAAMQARVSLEELCATIAADPARARHFGEAVPALTTAPRRNPRRLKL
jgi:AmiR/NasT family two-component response regulator